MTKQDHSPAPWTYGYNPYTVQSEASLLGVGVEIPAYEIFDAEGNKLFDTNEDSPAERQEANARLIATAPELLDALEGLLSERLRPEHALPFTERDVLRIQSAERKARYIIAKATGRSV